MKELGIGSVIKIRNIENQMVQNKNIENIGGKKWGLTSWDIKKKYIKELIIDIFLKEGKPLDKKRIIKGVQDIRPDIKERTIVSYLSYQDFSFLENGEVILKEWKSSYRDELRKKKKRRDLDKIVLDAFHYYQKK